MELQRGSGRIDVKIHTSSIIIRTNSKTHTTKCLHLCFNCHYLYKTIMFRFVGNLYIFMINFLFGFGCCLFSSLVYSTQFNLNPCLNFEFLKYSNLFLVFFWNCLVFSCHFLTICCLSVIILCLFDLSVSPLKVPYRANLRYPCCLTTMCL